MLNHSGVNDSSISVLLHQSPAPKFSLNSPFTKLRKGRELNYFSVTVIRAS
jgi:hypothetical protein